MDIFSSKISQKDRFLDCGSQSDDKLCITIGCHSPRTGLSVSFCWRKVFNLQRAERARVPTVHLNNKNQVLWERRLPQAQKKKKKKNNLHTPTNRQLTSLRHVCPQFEYCRQYKRALAPKTVKPSAVTNTTMDS